MQNIKYFPGLNALRFIAAYLVLMHHAEDVRHKNGLFHLQDLSLFNRGGEAVTFFFVLSGFLITYLLLREQRRHDSINIPKFYVRRVLRIWPLYFLLVFLGTILLPIGLQAMQIDYEMPYHFGEVILYFLFFMPFMVNILFGNHLLEPLWSIGVEEVFYLIWAPLVYLFRKNILPLLIGMLAIKIGANILATTLESHSVFTRLMSMLQFEAMTLGGLTAYWVFQQKEINFRSVIFSVPAQLLVLGLLILRFVFHKELQGFAVYDFVFRSDIYSNLILACLFAQVILHVSLNPRGLLKLEHRVLNYLGEISYGIYMYHLLIIFTLVTLTGDFFNSMHPAIGTILYYALISAAVFAVASVSKKYFEDPFLRLKKRYEK
jgi:peptidoglycan/LPS O-acetylase OafA/YrhL